MLEFCCREFDGLFAYEFTSAMEARLDRVADGTEPWKQICRDTWGSYSAKYAELKAGASTADAGPARQRQFAGGVKAVQSKKGPLLLKEGATKADAAVFYGWPEGKSFRDITEAEVAAFVATKVGGGGGTAALGTHEGKEIVKKSGPFGTYAECGGVRVPWTAEDTEESLQAKLAGKAQSMLHTLGGFEFRNGPYGVFMFKKDTTGKSRKFVSVPTGVDPKSLTVEAATKIYQTGLQTKAKATAFGKKNGAAK